MEWHSVHLRHDKLLQQNPSRDIPLFFSDPLENDYCNLKVLYLVRLLFLLFDESNSSPWTKIAAEIILIPVTLLLWNFIETFVYSTKQSKTTCIQRNSFIFFFYATIIDLATGRKNSDYVRAQTGWTRYSLCARAESADISESSPPWTLRQ